MYNVLFSFLKPQIAFGGESSGGGSSGGGGSRADRKGAQAILTTPRPAPTPPVVNTSRDRSDRKGAAAVMSAPRPAPAVSPITRAAEEDNRSIFDRLENIQLVSKDRPDLLVPKTSPTPKLRPKNLKLTSPVTQQQMDDAKMYGQYGQQPNAAEYAQMTEVMKRMRNVPSTSEFQSSVADQLRGGTTRRGGVIDADAAAKSAQNYISNNPVGENVNPFFTPFSELDGFLPKLERGIENAGIFAIKGLTGGIIDPVRMDKNMAEKYMKALQETGTYDYDDPNYLDISDSKQGNANFDKILEMSGRGPEDYEATNILRGVKDAEGNTVAGFNQYQNTITGYDPKTGEYESGAVVYNEEEREEDRDRDRCPEGFYYDVEEEMCMPIVDPSVGDADPTCPEGYIFDSEENACVLDPFQQPFPEAPTTGGRTYTAPALSPYTSVAPVTLPSLMPGQQPAFVVPTPTAQPITVAAQTPVGLASLRRS